MKKTAKTPTKLTANQRTLRAVAATARRHAAERTRLRFAEAVARAGLPIPYTEATFHPTRDWRLDYAWPAHKVALEVDGGIWVRGAHGRGSGIAKDHEKRNELAAMGWSLLVVQPAHLMRKKTIDLVAQALAWR